MSVIVAGLGADRGGSGQLEVILDKVYPVGSIYMSINPTDPQVLFGGTWAPLQDKFLIGAGSTYASEATGGEATHTLTADEMPSHSHSGSGSTNSAGNHSHDAPSGGYPGSYRSFVTADYEDATFSRSNIDIGSTVRAITAPDRGIAASGSSTEYAGSHSHSVSLSVGTTGGSAAHNNMPPYLAVYMWKRTA